MDKAPGVLIERPRVQRPAPPAPRLKLLVEWESRRRVFFRNLSDLVLARHVPPIRITSRPARFWSDVFVPTGAPWYSFAESMLWHVLVLILLIWSQSRVWTPAVKQFDSRAAIHGPITYYPPTFSAAESRAPTEHASHAKHASHESKAARQAAMRVKLEAKAGIVTPPDIKEAAARPPNLPGPHAATPMVPFSATAGLQRNGISGSSGVVAPPPQVDTPASRRLTVPQASAVAPAPELGGAGGRRTADAPNTGGARVVPPPPSVPDASNSAKAGRSNSLAGAGSNIVPPAPSVQSAGNAAGKARAGSLSGEASQVVSPPPSVQNGNAAIAGRLKSLPGEGPNVVGPPPSVQGVRNGAGTGRPGATTGAGTHVVPPPPSVQGSGSPVASGLSAAGSQAVPPPPSVQGSGGLGGSRSGLASGAGSEVVPPPATVEGAGNAGAGRRVGLPGEGSQIVPPPPPVESASNAGPGGRPGSLGGNGSQIVPTPPAADGGGGGNSGAFGSGKVLEPAPIISSSVPATSQTPPANNEENATIEELPVGLLGLVFAAPGSSYFSNYEVFVAKRKVGKDQLELIKLVYEFLPYQRRLSEYDLNNIPPRVIKLRVVPDPNCNESLGQIIEPVPDPNRPVMEYPKLPAALRAVDLSAVLPCYRTTATDFQRAMSRGK